MLICDQRPEPLKLDFALWNRGAVAVLIERECGIALSVRAVGNYLKRWGFTPQKPIKRAYEQRPEAVKAWLDEPYLAIEAQANAAGGEIHWGDDTAWVNTDVRGRGYAPKGKTTVPRAIEFLAILVKDAERKVFLISTHSRHSTNEAGCRKAVIAINPRDVRKIPEAWALDPAIPCSNCTMRITIRVRRKVGRPHPGR